MHLSKVYRSFTQFMVLIMVAGLVFSCSNKTQDLQFSGGKDLIKSEMQISIIDTFSLSMSTVQIDSLVTTGRDTILMGQYTDDRLGKVQAQSYFRVLLPSATVGSKDVFDSLTLILKPNGYYYGDTNVTQQLTVYQLAEGLTLASGEEYYNTSSLMAYLENPLGVINFKPQPKSHSKIEIRLNQSLGQTLFDLMLEKNENLTSIDKFLEYFKGLLVMPTGGPQGAIVGYEMSDSVLTIRMYAHTNLEEQVTKHFDFAAETGTYHFTRITHDRSGTNLSGLVSQDKSIPSTLTNHEVYLQGGTGLVPALKIPNLGKVLELDHTVILRAELLLKPVINTYNRSLMPITIGYYSCNNENQLIRTYIDPSTGATLYGALMYTDPVYNEGTYYIFNITPFVKEQLANNYYTGKTGLMFFYLTPNFNSSVNRLVLGDGEHPTQKAQLKLYLLHYE